MAMVPGAERKRVFAAAWVLLCSRGLTTVCL